MIEKDIEKIIIDKFAAALTSANIDGIQIIGAWQPITDPNGDVKAIEQPLAIGYLSVKVSPRSFEKFLDTEADLAVRVDLNIKAESDANGVDFVSVTSAISSVIYSWQRTFPIGKTDFDIANQFTFTGFRLDGGDCGIDRGNVTWNFIQNFTIQGIIEN